MKPTARSAASVLCLFLMIWYEHLRSVTPCVPTKRCEETACNLKEIEKAIEKYSKSRSNTQDWEKSLEELKEMEELFKDKRQPKPSPH